MSANQNPIFSKLGAISSCLVTAANTKSDGAGTIGTDIFLAFQADTTNGGFVERVRWNPTGTVANTTTTATVGRIFISSAAAGAVTSANCWLYEEITLPAVTADSSTNQNNPYDIPLQFALPPGYTILVTNHAAPAANTAWRALVIAGSY